MEYYDPHTDPEPASWLALDEGERVQRVLEFHEIEDEDLAAEPGDEGLEEQAADRAMLHAMIHAVVENQLALEVTAVRDALRRLQGEGLDRHEAVHAIGSILARSIAEYLHQGELSAASDAAYHRALGELTAQGWRESS